MTDCRDTATARTLLVTGAGGQVGRALAALAPAHPQYRWHLLDRAALDLTDRAAIADCVDDIAPDVVINCAAYTAVDRAEAEPELAEAVNHHAVAALAQATRRRGASILHISTDYVFSGEACRPWPEDAATGPVSVYGRTKLAGERALIDSGACGAIVRTSWVFDARSRNFVTTMRRLGAERDRLGVVADQVGSPTAAADLAAALLAMVASERLGECTGGIYHYANAGVCSWYDFAHAIMAEAGLHCEVEPITTTDYPTPAARPAYSVLDTRKIRRDFGLRIPHWRDSLARVLGEA